jgi:hypothetical protein
METSVLVAVITASSSILIAALTFFLTKRHQLKVEWQHKKLEHYMNLLLSLSDLAIDRQSRNYASASNTISLVASQAVITALMELNEFLSTSNNQPDPQKHDKLVRTLMLAIRADIGLAADDDPASFQFRLFQSGPPQRTRPC